MGIKSLVSFLFLLSIHSLYGQCLLTVFDQNGENFILFVDGEQKNKSFHYKVEQIPLSKGKHSIKIIFEDAKKPDVTQRLALKNMGLYTYEILSSKKSSHLDLLEFKELVILPGVQQRVKK